MRLKSVSELGCVNSLMMLMLIKAINDDNDYIHDNWAGELGGVVCLVLHTGSEDHAGQRLGQLCPEKVPQVWVTLHYQEIVAQSNNQILRNVHLSPGVLGKPGILPRLGSARLAKNSVSFSSFSTSCNNKLLNKPKQLQCKIEILEEV